jgi:phosphatidylglycerophosphate synthase
MKNLSIPIKFGIAISVGLIAYFLILSLFGAHTNPIYSLFNGVIMGVGIYQAIKTYRQKKESKFKYQKGFSRGLLTGFNATIIFTIFFGIYATELNPNFLAELITMWRTEYDTNIGIVLFGVALMGFATSVVLTLSFMQYFKRSWNTKEGQEQTLGK